MELMDNQAVKVLLVLRVQQGPMDRLVSRVMWETKVCRERRELVEPQGHQEQQDQEVLREVLGLLVSQELLVLPG